ncbi:MAG TPA: Eco57I restriction-modification methylase domain-containing protein, partial [Hanamia sp.]|nr:Eco57I restriction-modification methylase domain-containing protein [Hanamia sp.]
KQRIIENCLFGVDINPNSVKICRLRLWIELLKNSYYKNATELETLPNIDINIKCGNSLVSRFAIDADLSQALKKSKWTIDSYRVAVDTYRNAENKDQKREMERLIRDIKNDFRKDIQLRDPKYKELQKLRGQLYGLTQVNELFEEGSKKTKEWKKQVEDISNAISKKENEIEEVKNNAIFENAFEWRFEFPEVLDEEGKFVGFDVVIGNPPYVRQEELTEFKAFFKSQYKFYTGASDIYVFFIEKGFQILKPSGSFIYIMPNKFMQAGYGQPARKFLLEKNIVEIIDFGDYQIFEEATTYPCILFVINQAPSESFKTTRVNSKDFSLDFPKYVQRINNKITHNSLNDETWIVSTTADQNLLQKLILNGEKLESYVGNVAKRGIVTGLTEAYVIDEELKTKLINGSNNSIIKPLLLGRDIKPYSTAVPDKYLLFIPWHFPLHDHKEISGVSEEAENLFKINYPEIYSHLLNFKQKLSNRNKTETGVRYEWYAMQRWASEYFQEFQKPKIMYQKFQIKPCFIYDTSGLFCNDSIWFIPTEDKTLLGILNSKVGWWLISKYCTAIQNGYQLIWKYFSQIPIAKGQDKIRFQINQLVNTILEEKKLHAHADIKDLELQIDQLVYQLYDLTEEEIAIVQNGSK